MTQHLQESELRDGIKRFSRLVIGQPESLVENYDDLLADGIVKLISSYAASQRQEGEREGRLDELEGMFSGANEIANERGDVHGADYLEVHHYLIHIERRLQALLNPQDTEGRNERA